MMGLTEKPDMNNDEQFHQMVQALLEQLEKFLENSRSETAVYLYETLISVVNYSGTTSDIAIRLTKFCFKLAEHLRAINKNSTAKAICESGRKLADKYELQKDITLFSQLIGDLDNPERHSAIMPSISKDTVGVYKLKLLSKLDNYFEVYRNAFNQNNNTLIDQVVGSITKLEVKFLYECCTELLSEYFSCICQEENPEKNLLQQFNHLENFIKRLIYFEKYKEARNLYRLVEEGVLKRNKIPAVKKLLTFLLRALYSLGEYELQNQSLPVDIVRDWLKYREILQESRMKFLNELNAKNIVERQQQFTIEIQLLIKMMMEHNYQLIGPPRSIIFGFIASGSISRGEISPYSDLECLLLVSQSEMLKRKYLTILLQLLDFKIYCLGESRMPWKGFHLDQGCSPFGHKPEEFSTDNSNTPEQIVQERIKLDKLIDDDGFSYSLLKPLLLYQYGDDNNNLFERFQRAVSAQLNSPVTGVRSLVYQEASLQQMERHWNFFLKRAEELNENNQAKDLKEIWLQPFTYICMDLRLIFNIEKNNCLAIIQNLGERCFLAFSFVNDASNAHYFLQTLRCQLQKTQQKQDEKFLLPNISNINQDTISRMKLSEQEYQKLIGIFYRIIDPLYRFISFWILDLSLDRQSLIQMFHSANFIDPALSYFKDQIEFYCDLALERNQLDLIQEKINPLIHNLIYTLIHREAKKNDYLSYYQCLPNELRVNFIKLLQQQKPAQLEEIKGLLKKSPISLSLKQWQQLSNWDKKRILKELKDAQQNTTYRYQYKDSVTHNYDGFDLAMWAHENGIGHGDHILLPLSLQGWNFPNANLQNLDLSACVYIGTKKQTTHASLEAAHFTGADFRGARLIETSLKGGTFVAANFENADLTAAQATGAHFEGADLRNIKAEKIILKRAKLNDAKLQGAYFSKAICIKADFKNAVVEGADFKGANLTKAIISGWRSKGADLSGANLKQVKINLKDFREVRLKNTVFIGAEYNKEMRGELDELQTRGAILTVKVLQERAKTEDLSGINLSSTDLKETKFPLKARLKGAIFRKANLQKTELHAAKLKESDFSEAKMQECQLKGAKLQNANLKGVDLSGADLVNANLVKANFMNASLAGANLCDAKLCDANLQGAELQNANITGTDFSGADLRGICVNSSEQLASVPLDWSKVKKGGLKNTFFSEEYTKNLSGQQQESLKKNGAIIEAMPTNELMSDIQDQLPLPKIESSDSNAVNEELNINSHNPMELLKKESEILQQDALPEQQNQTLVSSTHDLFIEAVDNNNNNNVQPLNVVRNTTTYPEVKHISNNLTSARALTTLNLSGNKIDRMGLLYFISFLKQQDLTVLELTNIQLGIAGVWELASVLKTHATLVTLKLGYNKLYNVGTCYIADALHENRMLKFLDLKFNFIGDKGTTALIKLLYDNECLQELNLEGNPAITEATVSGFKNVLKRNNTLTELNIENTSISSQQKHEIVSLVKNRNAFFKCTEGCDLYLMSELPSAKDAFRYKGNYIWLRNDEKLYYVQQNEFNEVKLNDIILFEELIALHSDKISSEKLFLSSVKTQLLDAIGKEDNDNKELVKNIYISRGEIKFSVADHNNYYTGDYMNVLLLHFTQEVAQIKTYPASSLEMLDGYKQKILSQNEDYVFIPLNVAYDNEDSLHKNHWIAVVIDKKNHLIFYIDPAQKTDVSSQLMTLEDYLGYTEEIICNPIDFQRKEKEEGWIRHCGAYVIEIFKCFTNCIKENKCFSGSHLPHPSIDHSISVQTVLSHIPCGESGNIIKIRENHVDAAYKLLVNNREGKTNSDEELLKRDHKNDSNNNQVNSLGHADKISLTAKEVEKYITLNGGQSRLETQDRTVLAR